MKSFRWWNAVNALLVGCLWTGLFTPGEILSSRIIYVSTDPAQGDTTSIQGGIEKAVNGDIVVVRNGLYTGASNTDLDFHGKQITVRSDKGPGQCIIEASTPGGARGFYFHSGESPHAVVSGFTLRKCSSAFYIDGSSPTINNCIITENQVSGEGIIVSRNSSAPTLYDCTITGNNAGDGSVIHCDGSGSMSVTNCTFGQNLCAYVVLSSSGNLDLRACSIQHTSVAAVKGQSATLTLSDCAISGTIEESAASGNGIHLTDGTLTMTNCSISENSGAFFYENGGGVYAKNSSVTITNCALSANEGLDAGGGIYAEGGSISVSNSNITGNAAKNGGGVYLVGASSATLENCTLEDNLASSSGGGLYAKSGPLSLNGCLFSRNHSNVDGGGLHLELCNPSSVVVTNCNLQENTGGGIHCQGSSPILTNCTLHKNRGPGLKCMGSSNPVVTNSILWANFPEQVAEGVGCTPVITYCDLPASENYNTAESHNIDADPRLFGENRWLPADSPCLDAGNNAAPSIPATDRLGRARIVGSAVDMGSFELNGTGVPVADFASNSPVGPAPLTVQFRDNSGGVVAGWAWDFGDGQTSTLQNPSHTYAFPGTYEVTLTATGPGGSDSTVKSGYVVAGRNLYVPEDYATIQGGIDAARDGDALILADGTYEGAGNTALDFKGKKIHVRSANGPEQCILDGADTAKGFHFHRREISDAVVSGLTLVRCTPAVYCSRSSPTVRNCVIESNSGENGGGIYLNTSVAVLKELTLTGNMALSGGGVYGTVSFPAVTNCVISGNLATNGGGIFLNFSSPKITNCSLYGNAGRALLCWGSSPTVVNSILWGNTPGSIGKNTTSNPSVIFSDIEDGYPGQGNLDVNPQFTDVVQGNYSLQRSSPCLDAGSNDNAPLGDRDGTPRPQDGNGDGTAVTDMGAYELILSNLRVSPRGGWEIYGMEGGPFSPGTKEFSVINTGENPLSWLVTWGAGWITGFNLSGVLQPGESRSVTLSIGEEADALSHGNYHESIAFKDLTENRSITVSADLQVGPTVAQLSISPSGEVHSAGYPGGPFSPSSVAYTLTNTGDEPLQWMANEPSIWLDLSATSGTLGPGGSAQVIASINQNAEDLKLGSYPANINFLNTTNDVGSTFRSLVLDVEKNVSSITCAVSTASFLLGQSLTVSGRITPAPSAAGAFVSIVMTPPSGVAVSRTVLANAQGEYTYQTQCDDITSGGTWKVAAGWNGDDLLAGSVSPEANFTVTKAASAIAVDAGSKAVKLGDAIDISGKLTPTPDCGRNLTGIWVNLLITGPGGRWDQQAFQTNDPFGHFVLANYTGFNALGQWTVQALFAGNEAYEGSSSEVITVQVVETAGYAVIVEGRLWNREGLASHNKTANFVYDQLRLRGLLETDIRYLNYDTTQPGVYGAPSRAAVQEAITQWARDKMNAGPANLYLVFVDHGSTKSFYLDPEVITSEDLAGWVDTLQRSLYGEAAVQEIVMLLGFCRSGSFLEDVAGFRRVCIASAAADEASYKGPLDPGEAGGVRDGEFFITEFFKSAGLGKSLHACFLEAAGKTRTFTSTGSGKPNGPYTDDAKQHPLLEDSGDGIGVNDPSGDEGEDGYLSQSLYMGVSSITHNDPGEVQVTEVSETQFLGVDDVLAAFWARVNDNTRMRSLWLEVKPPGYAPEEGGTEQLEMDLYTHTYLSYNTAEDRYEWSGIPDFIDPGPYQVFFFARDNLTGNLSSLKETIVYKAKEGNQAPGLFPLLSPADGEETSTNLSFVWGDSLDPEADTVTYTLEVATDPGFSDVAFLAERIVESRYLMDFTSSLQDLTTYYWRVIAIDPYGARTYSNQTWHFQTNNTNANYAQINTQVKSTTGERVTGATLKAGTESFLELGMGHYHVRLNLGKQEKKTLTLTAEAPGYLPQTLAGVVVDYREHTKRDFVLEPKKVATPTFSPQPKVYGSSVDVTLGCVTPSSTIRYTTDGTEPNGSSQAYSSALHVTSTTTIKAKAFRTDWDPSDTVTATYTINQPVATPVFSPASGTYMTPQNVTLSCATSGATIRFTTDGSTPTEQSQIYSVGILVLQTTTLKAKAFKTSYAPSETASAAYTITGQVAQPTFSPAPGNYTTAQQVSIACATGQAVIRYTTNGTEPTESSAQYQAPILVSASVTLKAKAYKADWLPSDMASGSYSILGTVAPPVFSPKAGTYTTPQNVTLSCATETATIRYTLDGSEPTEASALYVAPIPVSATTTIRARAFKTDWTPSQILDRVYTITGKVASPAFSPAPGTYDAAQELTLSSETPEAVIRYTTNGTEPTETSTLFTGPISIATTTIIRAKAFKTDWTPSDTAAGTFTITGTVSPPVLSPQPGTFTTPQNVTISCITSDAVIHYTLDGTEPQESSPTYGGPILISATTTLKAKGFKVDALPSDTVGGTYTVTGQVAQPGFSPQPGIYTAALQVSLFCSTSEAVIRYTTDGSEPTESSAAYSTPIPISSTTTLKAKAFKTDWTPSDTATETYTVTGTVATPTASPAAKLYTGPQNVVLSCTTPDAVIHYTLDGVTEPSTGSPTYTGPIPVSSTTTLKAKAFKTDWAPSDTLTAAYTITGQVAQPGFSPTPKAYATPQAVTLTCGTPDATIRYTTDGSLPTEASPLYTGPIYVYSTSTLKARAFLADWLPSETASAVYTITGTLPPPTFSPGAGTYPSTQNVALSCSTPGAVIRYTVDGSEPTENSSLYAGTIPVAYTTTLKAKAFLADWSPSSTSSATYTITGKVAAPIFNPLPGTYTSFQEVELLCAVSGAVVRYTTNGSEPDESSTPYTTKIPVTQNTTLKARAFKTDWLPSDTASGTYAITGTAAVPTFSPGPGTYTSPQNVSLSSTTPSAVIRYTTNGKDPTESSTVFDAGSPILVSTTALIKARAFKPDWAPSETASGTFTITGKVPAPTLSLVPGVYTNPQSLEIHCSMTGAVVRYTKDGTEPTESSPLYLDPIDIKATTPIKAKAFRDDWESSDTVSGIYTITGTLDPPCFVPEPGVYTSAQNVSIDCASPEATVRYTTDGSVPTDASPVFVSPMPITSTVTLRARAFQADWEPSETAGGTYVITGKVATPTLSPDPRIYESAQTVTLSCATPEAVVRYTTDGTEPSAASPIYAGPIPVASSAVVKAKGFKTLWEPSDTASGGYVIGKAVTLLSPVGSEQWTIGEKREIVWNYLEGAGTQVKIELLQGTTVKKVLSNAASMGTGGQGSFLWTVNAAAGAGYFIRVTSREDESYTATSPGSFSILKPVILVNLPNGDSIWGRGKTVSVKWTYTGNPGPNVKVELYRGTTLIKAIKSSTGIGSGGKGSCSWTVPKNLTPGVNYQVRITDIETPSCRGRSARFAVE